VGELALLDRRHAPVAFGPVAVLRLLEVVDAPEERQPAVLVDGRDGGEVRRVDDEHRVELEADRTRPDAAYAGEPERAERFLVARPAANLARDGFEHLVLRRLLDEANERFDVGAEGDETGRRFVVGPGGREGVEEREVEGAQGPDAEGAGNE